MKHVFTKSQRMIQFNEGTGYYDSGTYQETTLKCSCGYQATVNDYYKTASEMIQEHKEKIMLESLGISFEDKT